MLLDANSIEYTGIDLSVCCTISHVEARFTLLQSNFDHVCIYYGVKNNAGIAKQSRNFALMLTVTIENNAISPVMPIKSHLKNHNYFLVPKALQSLIKPDLSKRIHFSFIGGHSSACINMFNCIWCPHVLCTPRRPYLIISQYTGSYSEQDV